jgi:hypothetical protein
LACPFFMPTQRSDDASWLHPVRLPLGAPFDGHCCAPGHEAAQLSSEEIKQCNLGYASQCSRLPQERTSDAVRFGVVRESGTQVFLRFVCEKNYRPAEDGILEYDSQRAAWTSVHATPQIQKMAECYLEGYRSRRNQTAVDSPASENT